MGAVQGDVAHALHWIWPVSTPIADRHVAHHAVHDLRSDLLRPVPWTRHQLNPELGLIATAVPRKGMCPNRHKLQNELTC